MNNIEKVVIDNVLKNYKDNCRFLKTGSIDYPEITAGLEITDLLYNQSNKSIGFPEAFVCIDQLRYVLFGQGIIDKKIDHLEDMEFGYYLDIVRNNNFRIASPPRIEFPGKIYFDAPFRGEMKIRHSEIDIEHEIYVAKLEFSLGHGAWKGRVDVGIRNERKKDTNQQTTIDDNYNV